MVLLAIPFVPICAAATSGSASRPPESEFAMTTTLEALQHITTGTITTMLLKKGIRRAG